MITAANNTHSNEPITVLGYQVRTDNAGSAVAIPALWREVHEKDLLAGIPGKTCLDIFAVYTNLEQSGRSNHGWFSFIIGAPVEPGTPVPDGMVLTTIPSSARLEFPAPENDPTRIIEAWQSAWASDDAVKTFICEYERYAATGEVSVNIGVRSA